MKKIGVVTGATGGLGKAFIKELLNEDLDEIWALARDNEKLEKLKEEFGNKIFPVVCDFTKKEDIDKISNLFYEYNPNIRYLINNAGVGNFGHFTNMSDKEISDMIDINCKAPTLLCQYAIPYMFDGARILNISSASAFQPNPYITIYSASKVYLRSFTRSLNYELKDKKITATAVCPGWVQTDMIKSNYNGKKVKFPGIVTPDVVVKKAFKDTKKGRDMSVCSLFVKYEHLLSKLFSQKRMMKAWGKAVKKYIN